MAINHSLKTILAVCTFACSIGFSAGTITATHVAATPQRCRLVDLQLAVQLTLASCRSAVSQSCGQCSTGPGHALLLALSLTADINIAINNWLVPTFSNCHGSIVSITVLIQLVNGVCDLLASVLTLVVSLNLVIIIIIIVTIVLQIIVTLVASVLNVLLGLCVSDPRCALTSGLLVIVLNVIVTVITGCF